MTKEELIDHLKHLAGYVKYSEDAPALREAIEMLTEERTEERMETHACDLISRQAAIDALTHKWNGMVTSVFDVINSLPSAQPEIIRCKDCEYGEQDEVGRWFCRSLGCQIGNEDGSGFCADAERRKE